MPHFFMSQLRTEACHLKDSKEIMGLELLWCTHWEHSLLVSLFL